MLRPFHVPINRPGLCIEFLVPCFLDGPCVLSRDWAQIPLQQQFFDVCGRSSSLLDCAYGPEPFSLSKTNEGTYCNRLDTDHCLNILKRTRYVALHLKRTALEQTACHRKHLTQAQV